MFKTYMASAGAGKTTSLVAEYLSICLRDDQSVGNFRNILAVTFTNNATAEMKGRIVETLQQFAFLPREGWGGSEKAICEMVMKALPDLTAQQLQQRSENLLAEILYDYPNFSISTIDSFFQRIVRAFAFELGISMSYEVEVTLDDCFQQTVDLLLSRISKENPDLRDAVLELVEEQMADKGRWRIEGKLLDLLRVVYGDESTAVPLATLSANDQLKEGLKRQKERLQEAREQLLKVSEGANDFLETLGLDDKQLVKGRANGSIYCWFTQYDPFTIKLYSCLNDLEHAYFLKEEGEESDVLNAKIIARCRELLQAQENYSRLKVLYGRMKTLSLLFDLKSMMDEIRERDNKFFLSDTNYKIYSEVNDQDTPFIYEKIGNRYRHFFIDEFQDTSRMQWDNMIPLLKNALAFPDSQVILFGDVKQAIYRFRNGDAQLLTDLSAKEATEEYLKLSPGDVKGDFRKSVPMKVNYRSEGNIVEFNNAFFQQLPNLDGFRGYKPPKDADSAADDNPFAQLYQSYYHAVHQEVRPGKEGRGVVCVRFMEEGDNKDEYLENQVNAAVKDAIEKGYGLCDLAVLTSSNDDGSFLGRTLTKAGYKVISSESLMLNSSPEVNLVLAVLGYVCRPNDSMAQYIIAHYALGQREKDVSKSLESLIPQLGNESAFRDFMAGLGIRLCHSELVSRPLFTLVNDVLRIFSINKADAFVIALMDNILDYLKNQNGEIASFLDWWERKGESLALKAPSGLDAITISTIHKAKGLQYPVVIMPFTQYGNTLTKKDYWYKKEDEETSYLLLKMDKSLDNVGLGDVYDRESMLSTMDSLNKIYVAQTRAECRMYILTGRQSSSGNYNKMLNDFVTKSLNSLKKLHFVQDVDDALCFWWGNREERRSVDGKSAGAVTEEIAKMYSAGFGPAALSTHIVKEETREQEVGNAIHDYLSRQTHFPLTEENVNAWKIDADQPYADEIREALRCIARHTEWHPYFADGVKVLNEVSILPTRQFMQQDSREGEVRPRLTYRPDRVVQLEDRVVVLDYKTGHPTEAARAAYERQVSTYVELLSDMSLGPVCGEVLYLNEV